MDRRERYGPEYVDILEQGDKIREKLEQLDAKLDGVFKVLTTIPSVGFVSPNSYVCICSYHRHGESSGGWYCPFHGQMY